MKGVQNFIDFILTKDMQIIERTLEYVVIRQYDVCLEYPYITTIDYEEYLKNNVSAFKEFKEFYLDNQIKKVEEFLTIGDDYDNRYMAQMPSSYSY